MGHLLLHDDARPHTLAQTMEALRGQTMEIRPHRPYSLELAPSDYYIFVSTNKLSWIFDPSTKGYCNFPVAEKVPPKLVCSRNATASQQMARKQKWGGG